MQVQVNNASLSLDAMLPGKSALLRKELANALGIKPVRIQDVRITRKSVDARKKQNVHFVVNALAKIEGVKNLRSLHPKKGVSVSVPKQAVRLETSDLASLANASDFKRPLVVGAGPAGLFCALALSRAGLRPLLIERGRPVEDRLDDVEAFASGGPLNEQSNIQFGEGGAGTFSDGKLTTGTKSPHARFVLEEFVACGAPEDILVDAKPHIGTDYLPAVVRNLRQAIIEAGGEVRFSTQLVGVEHDIDLRSKGFSPCPPQAEACAPNALLAKVRDLETGTEEDIPTTALILATGHSARDTFQMLHDEGVAMERKPFAMGVRIEHAQAAINEAQYGQAAAHPALPPADYKLAVHNQDGRGVYTFCMCPGGQVVAAASEEGGVCVNGMSNHARDGQNANSALLVEVRPDDLPPESGVLAGMRLQRELEQAAFRAGGKEYTAPAQTVGAFLAPRTAPADQSLPWQIEGMPNDAFVDQGLPWLPQATINRGLRNTPDNASANTVIPTYPRGVRETDLHEVLPKFMTDAMEEALPNLGCRLRGFDAPGALMTAVEARSSSPVRILRDDALQSVTHPGIYPTGEGAGYAGGIMSAACDGLRVAHAVMEAAQLDAAADALKQGHPVVFPTDTVAGLSIAVDAVADAAVLATIKGRDEGKPIAWLADSLEALDDYGEDVPDYAYELAREGWPGALTLIVRASNAVPKAFQSAAGTIGLRMPASRVARALMGKTGAPLATTSANLAGDPAPMSVQDLSPAFAERAQAAGALIIQTNERGTGTASTVIDCTGLEPITLRS